MHDVGCPRVSPPGVAEDTLKVLLCPSLLAPRFSLPTVAVLEVGAQEWQGLCCPLPVPMARLGTSSAIPACPPSPCAHEGTPALARVLLSQIFFWKAKNKQAMGITGGLRECLAGWGELGAGSQGRARGEGRSWSTEAVLGGELVPSHTTPQPCRARELKSHESDAQKIPWPG